MIVLLYIYSVTGFHAVLPLRFQLCCGGSVKYRFIEFFVFDYDSLPYLLALFFLLGVTFPLVALDKWVN